MLILLRLKLPVKNVYVGSQSAGKKCVPKKERRHKTDGKSEGTAKRVKKTQGDTKAAKKWKM